MYQRVHRSLLVTYLVSALWHGLYPGFTITYPRPQSYAFSTPPISTPMILVMSRLFIILLSGCPLLTPPLSTHPIFTLVMSRLFVVLFSRCRHGSDRAIGEGEN